MEIWKPIANWELFYAVSNKGNIKSLRTDKVLRANCNAWGYPQVKLQASPIKQTCSVHVLVFKAFGLDVEGKPEVNHIDGNKLNNSIENLEAVSRLDNQRHANRIGLINTKGIKHHNVRLSAQDIGKIRNMYASNNFTQKELALLFGVTRGYVSNIVLNKNWGHV